MAIETRHSESIAVTPLFMALEVGSTTWKIAFATTRQHQPRIRQIAARDLAGLAREIGRATVQLGVPAAAPVRSCYEAGREGFWIHRALTAMGVVNVVVDPASIAVDRRARRAKTDRLDARGLVIQLMNAAAGDRRGWRELHVPSVHAEADRHLQREWDTVREDRTRIRTRIDGLLATQGVHVAMTPCFVADLQAVRTWDDSPLPPALVQRVLREWEHWQQVEARRLHLEQLRRARVAADQTDLVARQTRQLAALRGIGINGALTLTTELFAWRAFHQRPPGRRQHRVDPDAVPQRSDSRRARDQSERQPPRARAQHRARVVLVAVATAQRAQSLVSCALWAAQPSAPNRDRGRGP